MESNREAVRAFRAFFSLRLPPLRPFLPPQIEFCLSADFSAPSIATGRKREGRVADISLEMNFIENPFSVWGPALRNRIGAESITRCASSRLR